MKKSILSLLVLAFAAMTSTAMAQEVRQGAVIEFEKDVHDYGEIAHKGNGTYSFVFSNTGSEPLMISNAKGSCGCTVPSWPKEPIAPGASAKIDVTYDTKRVGGISKSVTITSNAVNTPVKVIRIKGTVLAPAPEGEVAPVAEAGPVADAVEEVPPVREEAEEVAPLTKKQIKAKAKAEKKRLKKEAKAKKKAAKLALKKEKAAMKAEAKAAA
ncbi:MAG: DUF1573 domain-containing protein [Crocinitomicaceae bacterium]|nr:DUF1573 domain-containing protein [Crocinitomicaceae bacterium]